MNILPLSVCNTSIVGMVISGQYMYAVIAKEEESLLYVEDAFMEKRQDNIGEDVRRFLDKYSLAEHELSIVFLDETKHSDERIPAMGSYEIEQFLRWEGERLMPWDRAIYIDDYLTTKLDEGEEQQLYISAISRELLAETVMGIVKGRAYLQVVDAWPASATHILGEKEELQSYVQVLMEEDCLSLMAFLGSGMYDCIRIPMTAQALDEGMEAVDAFFCSKGFPAPSGVFFSAIGPDAFEERCYQSRYIDLKEDQSPCLTAEEAAQKICEHWTALPFVDVHLAKNAKNTMVNASEIQWQAAVGLCIRNLRQQGKNFSFA